MLTNLSICMGTTSGHFSIKIKHNNMFKIKTIANNIIILTKFFDLNYKITKLHHQTHTTVQTVI